jgi:hypothetical protein
MKREDFVLAVLSTSPTFWTPVQVQKLFFLLDRKLGPRIDGPVFNFIASDYGPYDADVYHVIDQLEKDGWMIVRGRNGFKSKEYVLYPIGVDLGRELFAELEPRVRMYINTLSEWVRKCSFSELVAAIYKEYPEMRANAVFRESIGG